MGVALYIVPERDVPGLDTFVSGKSLGRNEKRLDRLAQQAGVEPLMAYFSQAPEEAEAFFEEMEAEPPEGGFAPADWFPAEDGLATVRALLSHLAANPSAVPEQSSVIDDLRQFESVLERLESAGVRWHLAVDY